LNVYDLALDKLLFTLPATHAIVFNNKYLLEENEDGKGLTDLNGAELLPMQYDEIQTTHLPNLLYIEKNEKGAYFHASSRSFIWKEEGFDSL
jgi:hypothetical protein